MMPFSRPGHQPFILETARHHGGALLIHGFPGTPAEMRPLGTALQQHGYTAYGILLPGFGPNINQMKTAGKAAWLSAAREQWQMVRQKYETAVLVGYSMGGALAVHLAAELAPDYMILLAPYWRLETRLGFLLPIVKHILPEMAPFYLADFNDPSLRHQLQQMLPEADINDPEHVTISSGEFGCQRPFSMTSAAWV